MLLSGLARPVLVAAPAWPRHLNLKPGDVGHLFRILLLRKRNLMPVRRMILRREPFIQSPFDRRSFLAENREHGRIDALALIRASLTMKGLVGEVAAQSLLLRRFVVVAAFPFERR